MASYIGSFDLTLRARLDDGTTLAGGGSAPWTLADLRFDEFGRILGRSVGNAGNMPLTIAYPNGETDSVLSTVRVPGLDLLTTLDGFALPLGPFLQEFGDGWTQTITLAADRTSITYSGSVAFDEIDDGLHVVGTLSASATLLLDNTWPRFSLRAIDSEVAEGTAARFVITRSGNTAVAASAGWSLARPGDWPPHPAERQGLVPADFPDSLVWPHGLPGGSVEFAPGETSREFEIPTTDDGHDEADEAFVVMIDRWSTDPFLGDTFQAAGRILDNDAPAFVSILPVLDVQTEGPDAALVYRLHRSGGIEGPADLWYAVSSAGPRPASIQYDFPWMPGTVQVSFPAGVAEIDIAIPIFDDRLVERPESLRVTLSDPSPGLSILAGEATGTILSDDPVAGIAARYAGTDTTVPATPTFYNGPANGLDFELIAITPEDLLISTGWDLLNPTSAGSWFLRTGSGNDAIAVQTGRNVLDAGTGSNFLTGGHGADTFFLDLRGLAAPVWSTVANLGSIDTITIWGINADTPFAWQEWQGAPGYQGLTLVTSGPNGDVAALTIAGWTLELLDYWRMGRHFGHDPAMGT
jgi:hypothetical protein